MIYWTGNLLWQHATLTRKNMNLPYMLHTYVLNEFLTADLSRTAKYF